MAGEEWLHRECFPEAVFTDWMNEDMSVGASISLASRIVVGWETIGVSTQTGGHPYSGSSLLFNLIGQRCRETSAPTIVPSSLCT